jgi:pimeloyl-ACP methyl ester carboxylesterase
MFKVVVFLPGTTGTTLLRTVVPPINSVVVWPDLVYVMATGTAFTPPNPQAAANMLENFNLYPGGVLFWTNPGRGYGSFATFFQNQGYTVVTATAKNFNQLPTTLSGNLLIGFGYDWRQDNTTSAQGLRMLLSTLSQKYGSSYELFLIGHSMGGLVSRAYLETSISQGDAWYSQIKGLITLGTPHLGAPLALDSILGTLNLPSVNTNLETMATDFVNQPWSYSTYELLPPNFQSCAQTAFITDGGNSYNIFNPGIPQEVLSAIKNLSTNNLSLANTFLSSLNYIGVTSNGTPPLPGYYYVAGDWTSSGTCQSFTYASQTLTEFDGNPGDGDVIVPTWSALFNGRTVPPVQTYVAPNVNHTQLPGDPTIQQTVFNWVSAA